MKNCIKCKREIEDSFKYCPYCGHNQNNPVRKRIKRENGTGSVYKRKDLANRPWVAVAPAQKDKPVQIIGYYSIAQEAKDALQNYRMNPTTKLNITLKELFEEWKEIAYRGITKQTIDNDNASWAKLSELYNLKFREIRTAQMQKIIDYYSSERPKLDKKGKPKLDKDGKPVNEIPMSGSTLSKLKSLLTQLYKYAMENDIVNKNYAAFISLPKVETVKKERFSEDELNKIENSVGKVEWADVIFIMCYTGFRISELLELSMENYDPVQLTLTGGKKTEAGKNRIVPVHPKIQPLIEMWIAKGGRVIICDKDGNAMTADHFRRQCYYPALEKIGVRRLTPHATRHTCLSRLAAAGARPEDIQEIAGHEDYDVTANTYIHQDVGTLRSAMLLMK